MAKQQVWVLGNHAVNAVLDINPERALALWLIINPNNESQKALLNKAERYGIPIHPVDKRQLEQRCDSKQTQGVALQARPKVDGTEKELDVFVDKLFKQEDKTGPSPGPPPARPSGATTRGDTPPRSRP